MRETLFKSEDREKNKRHEKQFSHTRRFVINQVLLHSKGEKIDEMKIRTQINKKTQRVFLFFNVIIEFPEFPNANDFPSSHLFFFDERKEKNLTLYRPKRNKKSSLPLKSSPHARAGKRKILCLFSELTEISILFLASSEMPKINNLRSPNEMSGVMTFGSQ
jgi:hypothetical protein